MKRSPQNLVAPTWAMAAFDPSMRVEPSAIRAKGTQMRTEMRVV